MTLDFTALASFLQQVPPVKSVSKGHATPDGWEIEFELDLDDGLAWSAVQEFAYVLNMLSIEEQLPTRLMPVSPPPYLNGGPREYLSWLIQCHDASFSPDTCQEWLAGRMPDPVNSRSEWPDPED